MITLEEYLLLKDDLSDEFFIIEAKHFATGGLFFELTNEFGQEVTVDSDGIEVMADGYTEQSEGHTVLRIPNKVRKIINTLIDNYDLIVGFEKELSQKVQP